MKSHSAPFVLAALGVLSCAAASAADVDTAQWKCETCPYPKGSSGSVSVGVGTVSAAAPYFGDETGLQRKQAHVILGGSVDFVGGEGTYASALASDLGLDTRRVEARAGREGLFQVDLGYSELPRWLSRGAATPYLGVGGATLSLPSGYPAPGTAAMPLASTLQPVDLGYKLKRYDLGGSLAADANWSYSIGLHRDERDGTRPASASVFANAVQLAAPVEEHTDRLLVSAAYAGRDLQLTLGYEISQFRNGNEGVSFSNPFTPVLPGATQGQLALAPANDFQQVSASAGYTISPTIRASVNLAAGRLTQNAGFLPPTQNVTLLSASVLPATSLDGRIDTFNGSMRLTAAISPDLQLSAAYARDVRDNRTAVRSFTIVATDLYAESPQRSNTPFRFRQDRIKLAADFRASSLVRLAFGVDENDIERSYQEVVQTRETTAWGRGTVRPLDALSLVLRLAHADRRHTSYGTATWFGMTDNPLLRKYNLAARKRDTTGLRADYALRDGVSIGASADYAFDEYSQSVIGLTSARSVDLGLDVTAALGERTRLSAFGQVERQVSRQAGSASFSVPDWKAQNRDRFDTFGLDVRHGAIPEKLEVGAELGWSRSRSDLRVATPSADPGFPTASTTVGRVRLFASWRLRSDLWVDGSLLHEHLRSADWQLDDVQPATLPGLLAFGAQAPSHDVSVVLLSLRYRF